MTAGFGGLFEDRGARSEAWPAVWQPAERQAGILRVIPFSRHPGLDPGSSGVASAAQEMLFSRKDLRGLDTGSRPA
ncbi:hypothetical protein GGQ64_001252 [Rhizobium azooxidifex]|uniref:Uncharacterized protein n=1 Tax=Mycoplana azooxidifex TaxID=1636188 RepID=A0A7W6D8A6_9HYPH|nr:hypothetical protein [Mycoplana azooxidifex]